MTTEYTDLTPIQFVDNRDGIAEAVALIQASAQRSILPRHLEEGIHAIVDADGAINIVETPGYRQQRRKAWKDRNAPTPDRVRGHSTVFDVRSFIAYLVGTTTMDGDNAFEVGSKPIHNEGDLEVWASIDHGTVTAIINGGNGWRDHKVTLQLKQSREWAEWLRIDGKLLDQEEFAMFVEDHLSNIAAPDGALLLEICQTLQGTVGAKFAGKQILKDGSRTIHWEETTEASAGAKGDLKIPDSLILALRPYQGSSPVRIDARFRFRPIQGGGIKIGVKLAEPDRVLEEAFNETVQQVDELVPCPVLIGREP